MVAPVPADSETAEPKGLPGLPPDWPQQATEKVVDLVDNVRAKTAEPAIRISRAVVYGLLAAIVALFMLPVLLAGIIRLAHYVIPGNIYWIYLGLGAVFCLVGAGLWSKRPKGVTTVSR